MARSYLQRRVAEWHALMGATGAPETPTDLSEEMRDIHANVCGEEFAELLVAAVGRDYALEVFASKVARVCAKRGHDGPGELDELIDACVDSEFTCAGLMWRAGVEDMPFIDAVCDSNDQKAGGKMDENGKWQKPEGWKPPDIIGILRARGYGK
jgi:predicted HAD superfamily Cof-like phosphohydrolase